VDLRIEKGFQEGKKSVVVVEVAVVISKMGTDFLLCPSFLARVCRYCIPSGFDDRLLEFIKLRVVDELLTQAVQDCNKEEERERERK
jgi:hypothetical protein